MATYRTPDLANVSLVCDNPEGLLIVSKGVQSWACADVSARIVVRRPPITASVQTPDPCQRE
ncbi:hypothetical protein BIFCAT_00472 [Bifidobacterium catenulatum DSM 16992 = JCM 1194 = LMG 11043]|uniref:Uncharacterized protein n=1 Tax=Bifidobacterium catenulatum DSM 16992 = JCM 1194 = LMG 11043 TaxID=566552 RepID=B6XTA9_9BIFI|nr:hypothetical protein BIFCAT_00472 [Bifidobacterium catenulatum DSM 16992 = JCM 1194 = LMG 11043]NAB09458.1 hypothetical protein [Enterococcus durans]